MTGVAGTGALGIGAILPPVPSAVKARSTHAAMCEMLGDMSDMRGDDGLAIDGLAIGRPLSRRRALGLALVGAGSVLAGGAPLPLVGPRLARAAGGCVVRPALTEGPYFVDEKLERSDIRSDPGDGSVRPGVPLRLALRVSRLHASACATLPGATVDVWHCDAQGVYSDVADGDGRAIRSGRSAALHLLSRVGPSACNQRAVPPEL